MYPEIKMKSKLPPHINLSIVDEILPDTRSTKTILRKIFLKFIDLKYKYIGIIKIKTSKFNMIKFLKLISKLKRSPLNRDIPSVFKHGINFIKPSNKLNLESIKNSFTIILEKISKDIK